MLLLVAQPLSVNLWILIGVASFLVFGGSVCMLILSLRKPTISLDDETGNDRTHAGLTRNRPSPTQKEIIEGMAVSGSHPAASKDSTVATAKSGKHEEPPTSTWKNLWSGIVDGSRPGTSKVDEETDLPTAPDAKSEDPESMVDRPDFCPFCGVEPKPDYIAQAVEGGAIYSCPSCRCIVYYVPKDLAYKYLGQTYHVPAGQAFAIPRGSQVGAMTALPLSSETVSTDSKGMVVGLFDDVVDKP